MEMKGLDQPLQDCRVAEEDSNDSPDRCKNRNNNRQNAPILGLDHTPDHHPFFIQGKQCSSMVFFIQSSEF